LNSLDHFAGESTEFVAGGGVIVVRGGDGHFLKEDGYSLDRLVAQRTLCCGELEGVGNFVGKVAGLERFANSLFGFFSCILKTG